MLKCSRCGQYYIPGHLDCGCRMASRAFRAAGERQVEVPKDQPVPRVVASAKSTEGTQARPDSKAPNS